jgi:Tol biopolymer transport system component
LSDRLVVVRQDGLYEVTLADGNEQLLIANPENGLLLDPAVSPDRAHIAYTDQLTGVVLPGEEPDFGSDIYVSDLDGGNARLAYEHRTRGELARWPVWTPDGDLLVTIQAFDARLIVQVLRVDMETGDVAVLVDGAIAPGISADGATIAYVRVEQDFSQTLWMANADGSGERQIAGPGDGLGAFTSPRFAPDGSVLAFGGAEPPTAGVSLRAMPRANGLPADIWVADVATGELRGLADLDLDSPSLAWSGDGQRLFVFAGTGLYVIDPEEGGPRQVAPGTFHGQMDWLAAQ